MGREWRIGSGRLPAGPLSWSIGVPTPEASDPTVGARKATRSRQARSRGAGLSPPAPIKPTAPTEADFAIAFPIIEEIEALERCADRSRRLMNLVKDGASAMVAELVREHFQTPEPSHPSEGRWRHWEHRRFGAFRTGILLGVGAFGGVFEATEVRPRRTVALKLLEVGPTRGEAPAGTRRAMSGASRLGTGARPSAERRFLAETEALRNIDPHSNVATLYHGGVTTVGVLRSRVAMPWIASELVRDALSITSFVRSAAGDPDPTARILRLMIDVCDGVAHLHERRIAHRDLKPANIAVAPDGAVKVLDLGMAAAIDPSLPSRPDEHGAGTWEYMAPEQRSTKLGRVGPHSDVFALGVILHELFTGERPVEGAAMSLPTASAGVRGRLEAIVSRACSPRLPQAATRASSSGHFPGDEPASWRYRDAGALATELRSVLATLDEIETRRAMSAHADGNRQPIDIDRRAERPRLVEVDGGDVCADREEWLDRIGRAFARGASIVHLVGRPTVGKTTIASAFAAEVRRRAGIVVDGVTVVPIRSVVQWTPWFDAAQRIDTLLERWLDALDKAEPGGLHSPAPGGQVDPFDQIPAASFEERCAPLLEQSRRHGTLLVLDQLDDIMAPGSGGRIDSREIVAVLEGCLAVAPSIRALTTSQVAPKLARRGAAIVTIRLKDTRLPREAARELLRHRKLNLPSGDLDRVIDELRADPFRLVSFCEVAASAGPVSVGKAVHDFLRNANPARIVRERLVRYRTESERQVLEAAAVLGPEVEHPMLVAMLDAEVAAPAVGAAIDELVRVGIFRRDRRTRLRLKRRDCSALLRDLERCKPEWLQRLHQRAAGLLMGAASGAPGVLRAVSHLIGARDFGAAHIALSRIDETLAQHGRADTVMRLRLRLAPDLDDLEHRWRNEYMLSRCMHQLSRFGTDGAVTHCERALAIAQRLGRDDLLCETEARLGSILGHSSHRVRAVELLDSAIVHARNAGRIDIEATAFATLAGVKMHDPASTEDAGRLASRAAKAAADADSPIAVGVALVPAGFAAATGGDVATLRVVVEQLQAHVRQVEHVFVEANLRQLEALLAWLDGDLDLAVRLLETAERRFESLPFSLGIGFCRLNRGNLRLRAGDHGAVDDLDGAAEIAARDRFATLASYAAIAKITAAFDAGPVSGWPAAGDLALRAMPRLPEIDGRPSMEPPAILFPAFDAAAKALVRGGTSEAREGLDAAISMMPDSADYPGPAVLTRIRDSIGIRAVGHAPMQGVAR